MKTVYRVEHITYRHGPYVYEGMTSRNCELSSKMTLEGIEDQHPMPENDGITEMEVQLYCGFDSLDSLFDWFEKWLTDLEQHDYHVAVFNVEDEDIIVGSKQLVFPRKKYRRATSIPMGEVKQ